MCATVISFISGKKQKDPAIEINSICLQLDCQINSEIPSESSNLYNFATLIWKIF